MAESIREFLVSLGFKIDEAGERRFTQALEGAVVRANLLADAIERMASIAVGKIAEVSTQFEHLHYQAQRLGASEASIRAYAYAISQVGGSADAATASLQDFGDFLKTNPFAASAIANALKIPLKDAADAGKFLLEAQEKLGHMDRAFAEPFRQAYHLGDTDTFLAGRRHEAQGYYDQEVSRENEAGIGPNTSEQAVRLQKQWRDFSQAMDDYFIQAETNLSSLASKGLETLNQSIDKNHSKISEFVEWSSSLGFLSDAGKSGPVHFDEKKFGEHFETALNAAETAAVNELHRFEEALGPVVTWFERFGRALFGWFTQPHTGADRSPEMLGGDGGGGMLSRAWNGAKRALGFGGGAQAGLRARGTGGTPTGNEAALAQQAYEYWRGQGLNHDQALAVLGNQRGENALGSLNQGDGGSAGGQLHWHAERRADILRGTGIDVLTAGFMDQQRAARWEMENGAGGGHIWNALNFTVS
jgi:hypothetical protein